MCKAVVDEILDGDVTKVARYQVRFAGVVFPGETIVTSVWRDGDDNLLVAAHTKERDSAGDHERRDLPAVSVDRTATVLDDLAAEYDELDDLVSTLDDADWETSTPATPFAVRDQVDHLAFSEELAATAVLDPGAFRERLAHLMADRSRLEGESATRRAISFQQRSWSGGARSGRAPWRRCGTFRRTPASHGSSAR